MTENNLNDYHRKVEEAWLKFDHSAGIFALNPSEETALELMSNAFHYRGAVLSDGHGYEERRKFRTNLASVMKSLDRNANKSRHIRHYLSIMSRHMESALEENYPL